MAFSLDREGASRRLWVSSRTIDRHIQAGRIRTRRIGKKMFLEEDDIEAIRMADPARREEDYVVITDDDHMHTSPEIMSPSKVTRASENHTTAFTELVRIYEDTKSLVAQKDSIIQDLSYKLWKIETELANSIPVLEYKKTTFLLESAKSKSDSDADTLSQKIVTLESEVHKRNSALITLAILFILVLWFSVMFVLFGGSLK